MACSVAPHHHLIICLHIDELLRGLQLFLIVNGLDGNWVSVYRCLLFSRLNFWSGMAGSMVSVIWWRLNGGRNGQIGLQSICDSPTSHGGWFQTLPVLTNTWHCPHLFLSLLLIDVHFKLMGCQLVNLYCFLSIVCLVYIFLVECVFRWVVWLGVMLPWASLVA